MNSSYCRLCAESTQISDIIDLSNNLQIRNEIIEKLSVFSLNVVDFTDHTLPETICLHCKDAVRNSHDFFYRIKRSQIVLKDLKKESAQFFYSPETKIKKEEIVNDVKDEKNYDPFEDRDFIECGAVKTELDVDNDDQLGREEVSSEVYEVPLVAPTNKEKQKNIQPVNKKRIKKETKSSISEEFQCTSCGKEFPTWKELVRHTSTDNNHVKKKRTKATIEEKTCDICFKVFDIPAKLRYHKVKHTDRPRDYVCDVCGKAFYAKDSLYTHKMIHNPNTEICKICKKTFISLIRLRKHLKTHDVVKPFECNDCQRKFRTKYQLGKHMVVHSNVFPYSCEYCKKGFRFKNVLKTHQNIHTGAKPFVCTVCSMDFTNWSNCNKHMVRKHGVSLAKRVKTEHGMMPLNQETLKPKEVDIESVKWGELMRIPRKRGKKIQEDNPP